MAVIPNLQPEKYGGAIVDADAAITGFGRAANSHHFVGVQVAEHEVFAGLPDNVPSESTRTVYPSLIASRPGSVRAFVTEAEFFDIGTPADYLSTSLHFAPREDECILWDDVEIGANARLRRCIVTDGVRVPAGSVWENKTLRVAHGELLQNEQLAGELAIGPIDGSTLS
jgi:NDP-sugar pyrophosphorylase family protein